MVRRIILLFTWLLSDLILFVGCFILAYFLRVGWVLSTDFPFDRFLTGTTIAAPFWLTVLLTTRTFHFTKNQCSLRNAAYIGYASLVGVALFTLTYYFGYTAFFSRLLLVYAFLLTASLTFLWHVVFEQLARAVLSWHPPTFPTLIVGLTRESRLLIHTLQRWRNPLTPVALLDSRGVPDNDVHGVPVLGKLNKLEEVLREKHITHLIQCSDLEQSLNILSACRSQGITYLLLPSVLGIVERDERVESLEGYPVTVVSPRKSPWEWFFS